MSVIYPATTARGKYTASVRHYGADDPRTREAKRDLAAANIAATIGRRLADDITLTDDQVAELVTVLRGGAR